MAIGSEGMKPDIAETNVSFSTPTPSIESTTDQQSVDPSWPDTKILAERLKAEAELDPTRPERGIPVESIAHLLENQKAGRNLRIFAEHVSAQERKPVLVINNARSAAPLNLGFQHWLSNFKTEVDAETFVKELADTPEYGKTLAKLQKGIEELREFTRSELPQLLKVPKINDSTQNFLSRYDPSADIRLELISTSVRSGRRGSNFDSLFGVSEYLDSYRSSIDPMPRKLNIDNPATKEERFLVEINKRLAEINKYKDTLRQQIFKHAALWLNYSSPRINHFVYPINHFKISGNGPMEEEVQFAGEQKLLKTIMLPETITILADVHSSYRPAGNMYRRLLGLNPDDTGPSQHPETLVELARSNVALSANLTFPFAQNAEGKNVNVQRELLKQVQDTHPKFIDLAVVHPSMKIINEKAMMDDPKLRVELTGKNSVENMNIRSNRDTYAAGWGHAAGASSTGSSYENWFYGPDHIMDNDPIGEPGENDYLPLPYTKQFARKLENNPTWIKDFLRRIPIEPNYTYGGPEYLLYLDDEQK